MVLPGGVGGLVVLVIVVLVSQLGGGSGAGSAFDGSQVEGADLSQCDTGADATGSQQCRIVATVNSVQAFWSDALPQQAGMEYSESVTNLFAGSVDSGCGAATSDVGPFYCPSDDSVYLDTSFFDAMLEGQLGARGGDFAESYVVAHEYGHHIQDLLGTMARVRSQPGATSDSVRLELQADCYAGMWAKYATTVEDDNGEVFILDLSEADIAEAIDAAESVGDDRIQEQAQGRSDPETWTHGSAEDRKQWFLTGMSSGELDACDTFSADKL
jgi:predicted metalloprotease